MSTTPPEGWPASIRSLIVPAHLAPRLSAAARHVEALESKLARVAELEQGIDCACNALTDSVCVSGNDAETNMAWVRKLRALLARAEGGER